MSLPSLGRVGCAGPLPFACGWLGTPGRSGGWPSCFASTLPGSDFLSTFRISRRSSNDSLDPTLRPEARCF